MNQIEQYIESMQAYANAEAKETQVLKEFGKNPLREENEWAQALYASLCKKIGQSIDFSPPHLLSSGALPLAAKSYLPWGALPYPYEHAQVALLYKQMGFDEVAQKMGRWQRLFASTYNGGPNYMLFSQKSEGKMQKLRDATQKLFESTPATSFPAVAIDTDLGIAVAHTDDSTILCTATGCQSGMGCFLHHGCGVVNFGMQELPLGDCNAFGLAGRPLFLTQQHDVGGFSMQYQTRLSALKNTGYSGLWMKATCIYREKRLSLSCEVEGTHPYQERIFVFFGKGDACVVAGSHKLHPRSLDRYVGPPQQVAFQEKNNKVFLEMQAGAKKMEIIPIAGGDSFWSADFLIAYTLCSSSINYLIY